MIMLLPTDERHHVHNFVGYKTAYGNHHHNPPYKKSKPKQQPLMDHTLHVSHRIAHTLDVTHFETHHEPGGTTYPMTQPSENSEPLTSGFVPDPSRGPSPRKISEPFTWKFLPDPSRKPLFVPDPSRGPPKIRPTLDVADILEKSSVFDTEIKTCTHSTRKRAADCTFRKDAAF